MEFEEQDQEQDEEMQQLAPSNYVSTAAAEASRTRAGGYKYKECLKNHAIGIGGNAVDGCREFMPAGQEGTLDALRCAACTCHRNFHRKQSEAETMPPQYHRPSGYLVTPMSQQRPVAAQLEMDQEMTNPNPSSSGGGSSRKRFRTKFTREQKERMTEVAERLGWRIQQQDEAVVEEFCKESGIQRQVFKVWMHNNKHTRP